jgi:hypothetical protein
MKVKYRPELADKQYCWDLDLDNPMSIEIYHRGHLVMSLFLGEAMESAGRELVMQHVAECDRTPWLTRWRAQRDAEMMDLLARKYGYDQ